jgi:hypothetical protein
MIGSETIETICRRHGQANERFALYLFVVSEPRKTERTMFNDTTDRKTGQQSQIHAFELTDEELETVAGGNTCEHGCFNYDKLDPSR